jgi:hypothetical protein
MRRSFAGVALALSLAFAPAPAEALNACLVACVSARLACLGTATGAFVAAKSACPVPPDRRACVKAAKLAWAAARHACRATFKTCNASCGPTGGTACASPPGSWLDTVDFYRGLAGLGPVTERADLSAGDAAHADYMVRSDRVEHAEDPSSPFFTAVGNAAGQASDVAGHSADKDEGARTRDMAPRT